MSLCFSVFSVSLGDGSSRRSLLFPGAAHGDTCHFNDKELRRSVAWQQLSAFLAGMAAVPASVCKVYLAPKLYRHGAALRAGAASGFGRRSIFRAVNNAKEPLKDGRN